MEEGQSIYPQYSTKLGVGLTMPCSTSKVSDIAFIERIINEPGNNNLLVLIFFKTIITRKQSTISYIVKVPGHRK